MPKLMGWIADNHGMSVGFIVPAACFLVVALYGASWSKLSGTKGLLGVDSSKGH
jgi:FHS family L-fucose permease-like MFS transporter